jgi:hypothetical protein
MNPPISKRRRVLGYGAMVVGPLTAFAVLLPAIFSLFTSLGRIDSPGVGELRLEPGNYAIYYESPALAAENSKVPGITVRIQPKAGGEDVTVSNDILFPLGYSSFEHHGALSAEFTIVQPEEYRISVSAPLLKQPAPGNISIARALGVSGFVRLAVIPFTLFWSGIGVGLWILLKRPSAAAP